MHIVAVGELWKKLKLPEISFQHKTISIVCGGGGRLCVEIFLKKSPHMPEEHVRRGVQTPEGKFFLPFFTILC